VRGSRCARPGGYKPLCRWLARLRLIAPDGCGHAAASPCAVIRTGILHDVFDFNARPADNGSMQSLSGMNCGSSAHGGKYHGGFFLAPDLVAGKLC